MPPALRVRAGTEFVTVGAALTDQRLIFTHTVNAPPCRRQALRYASARRRPINGYAVTTQPFIATGSPRRVVFIFVIFIQLVADECAGHAQLYCPDRRRPPAHIVVSTSGGGNG